jgi:4-alpha-glucanotransferase
MTFGRIDHFLSGVALPVSALRSGESCGVGEFADLPLFGRWCVEAGLELIQLLPVNDSGANSSPYSALSAYALHPLYLRLQNVPGVSAYASEIREFRAAAELLARFSYHETLTFKTSIVRRIFEDTEKSIRKDRAFSAWRDANPWVVPYAAFKALKETGSPGAALPRCSDELLSSVWTEDRRCLMHAWVQYLLEGQLSAASRELEDIGLRLKGDIPILMNEDSADVWSFPRYFDLSLRAGAPPDMYSTEGQNWGFPIYDWDTLAADGYSWWKDRLRQAAKFFHAFRIDHVLGFFRIWCIPKDEDRGLLGRFSPSLAVTRAQLNEAGFDKGRIRWLSVPHVRNADLSEHARDDAPRVRERYFDRVGAEELFTLKTGFDSERAILAGNEPTHVKDYLTAVHADRALLALDGESFAPCWYFWQSTSFKSLTAGEQDRLRQIIGARRRESEEIWEARGTTLLGMLRDTTDMLVCAEDLGDVPDCVPRVLSRLGILGLRIARWAREYNVPGAPFISADGFPRLSVCTASVHDTSTLRAWWEENPSEREAYFRHLGHPGACPERLDRHVLTRIVEHLMSAGSILCILQLQEILDLDEANWSPDPREDRINVPGTVNDWNWGWRMPLRIEELAGRREPAATLRALSQARRARALT